MSKRPIWEELAEIAAQVSPEEWAKLPKNLSSMHNFPPPDRLLDDDRARLVGLLMRFLDCNCRDSEQESAVWMHLRAHTETAAWARRLAKESEATDGSEI